MYLSVLLMGVVTSAEARIAVMFPWVKMAPFYRGGFFLKKIVNIIASKTKKKKTSYKNTKLTGMPVVPLV